MRNFKSVMLAVLMVNMLFAQVACNNKHDDSKKEEEKDFWYNKLGWEAVKVGASAAVGAASSAAATAAAGFSAAGPVAGSAAAAWQASIGSVAAGSAFSTVQAAAMTGVVAGVGAPVLIVGGAVGSAGAIGYAAYTYFSD